MKKTHFALWTQHSTLGSTFSILRTCTVAKVTVAGQRKLSAVGSHKEEGAANGSCLRPRFTTLWKTHSMDRMRDAAFRHTKFVDTSRAPCGACRPIISSCIKCTTSICVSPGTNSGVLSKLPFTKAKLVM